MGHRFTGIIAYQQLPEQLSNKILTILEKHPEYQSHFIEEMPEEIVNASQEIKGAWLFSQMACWPDVIKDPDLHYDPQHRRWHYINLPILLTDSDERYYKDNVPSNLERLPNNDKPDDWNISQAYHFNKDLLGKSDSALQAVALCWLFHLIGDIHQPLHSTAVYNERRFAKGDAGGNSIDVKPIGILHAAWDRATYNEGNKNWNFEDYVNYCDSSLSRYYADKDDLTERLEFEGWLQESYELAKVVGYPKELLDMIRSSAIEQYGFGNPLRIKLDKTFTSSWYSQIVSVANHRISLAGFRIGGILRLIYAE